MKHKRLLSAGLLCLLGIGIASVQCVLTERHYIVTSSKLPAGKRVRLVMLSDLHSCVFGKDQSTLINKIRDADPDLILLCGDIVDDRQPTRGAALLLKGITEIAPCFYVSGNHEYWSAAPENTFASIAAYGIRVLQNEREQVSVNGVELILCGVEDPAASGVHKPHSYGSCDAYISHLCAFDDLPPERYTVLLAHRPEYFEEYAAHPFDLVLSGHAHGGQFRFPPLLNGLVAPGQGFFPKYAGGIYRTDSMVEIVGRGLVVDWRLRLFNPPEIVVVDLEGSA